MYKNNRCFLPVGAYDHIGISPPRGSPAAALIACDGLVTARTVTGRKYHYPAAAVVAFVTAASVTSES